MKKNKEPRGLYHIDGGIGETKYYIVAVNMIEAIEIHRAKAGEDPGEIECVGTEASSGVYE